MSKCCYRAQLQIFPTFISTVHAILRTDKDTLLFFKNVTTLNLDFGDILSTLAQALIHLFTLSVISFETVRKSIHERWSHAT